MRFSSSQKRNPRWLFFVRKSEGGMRVTSCFVYGFDTHIKTGNSQPFKAMCQIRSRLIQLTHFHAHVHKAMASLWAWRWYNFLHSSLSCQLIEHDCNISWRREEPWPWIFIYITSTGTWSTFSKYSANNIRTVFSDHTVMRITFCFYLHPCIAHFGQIKAIIM